jgi:glycosyltransferase involved in cell wall biosynthesis
MRVSLAMTNTTVGGVWRNVIHLAEGLRERGHDVSLGLSTNAGGPRMEARERDFDVHTPIQSIDRRRQVWHVHLHDTYDARAAGLLAARHTLGPTVVTEHLPHFNGSDRTLLPEGRRSAITSPVKTALKRISLTTCDAVIVPSERVTSFFRHRYRLGDTGKLHSIPLGVPAKRAAEPIPDGALGAVLASGSMISQKGFDLLAEAVRVSTSEWPLTILGDGPHRAALEGRFAGLLGSRVLMPGWQEDPLPWLDRARVVCLPSRWETSPFAAIEAQLGGRAVVAFAVDGIPEIVEHEVTGLLVAPNDVHGLARALDRLSGDRALAAGMGAAGRERALARFGLSDMIDRMEHLYQEVIDARRKR